VKTSIDWKLPIVDVTIQPIEDVNEENEIEIEMNVDCQQRMV
tara:strand:+ start:406 stop:531 length:126 start_codon:yes stop_codon:yes gene_type:complete